MAEFERANGVAIVTGAAGGMGSHCARLLGEDGWPELLLCDLDEARLAPVAEKLAALGARVDLLGGEITDPGFPEKLLARLGGRAIGAVIHTAGVSPAIFGDKDRLLEINLDATQAIVDSVRPRMAEGGAVVLFASMASYFPISPEADAAFEAPLPAGGTAELRHLVENAGADATCALTTIRWHAPIPRPSKNIFCLGLNYLAHARESGRARGKEPHIPQVPVFFTKAPTSVTGPNDDVAVDPSVTGQVDWEVELGVVIGLGGRNISRADALQHVFGYTVINDLSARDEETELAVQVQLLKAGVLTIDEVRAMRGLAPLTKSGSAQLAGEAE